MSEGEEVKRNRLSNWTWSSPELFLLDLLHGKTSAKRDDMAPQEDAIIDIPKDRVKFFGGMGKMLLPSPATVAALIKKIPEGKLITTNQLRKRLTDQFKVRGTCPVTTQKALKRLPMTQVKISLTGGS